MKWKSLSRVWLCDPMDYTRILEQVAFPFSRGSFQPRDRTQVSHIAGRFFTIWATKGSPRILEWVAYPLSSGSSWPRNWTGVSCTAGRFLTNWAIREVQVLVSCGLILNSPTYMWLKFPKKRGSQTENNILRNNDRNAVTMKNNLEVPQKFKNRIIIWSNNPTFRYISKRIEKRISGGYFYTDVHCTIVHNGQGVEGN